MDDGGRAPSAATPTWYAPDLDPEELAFQRLYGPWRPFSVTEIADLFTPLQIRWWIAGGYAVDAFTELPREHDDIDVCVFRRDVDVLREAFEGKFHLWSAGAGLLRPLTDNFPGPHDQSDQIWLREHALAPWRADVLLNPDHDGDWVSRRDPSFAAPLGEVTWSRDGVRYLNPEIVLAFKAKLARPKDEQDFAAAVPLLTTDARAWLADYLARCEPDHSWRARL